MAQGLVKSGHVFVDTAVLELVHRLDGDDVQVVDDIEPARILGDVEHIEDSGFGSPRLRDAVRSNNL